MGNFFTSTQIYSSDAAKRDKFIDTFCKAMEKEGYVTCDGDEAEKSYILKFADNCNWVTITSESYEQGNQTALSDTGRIAKMLKTTCINTTVIDSDCAVMALYAKSGQKADTLVIGRADDYFGRKVPKLSKDLWKPFLADGSSWEKLCKIVEDSENYTFVEDVLSELAPLIGMDDSNILFSADDANEDEQTVFLNFKKAETKKEKKLTLKGAFKQVYGKALEPLGFIYAKTKKPCYLRLVDNDMVHIIALSDNTSSLNIESGIFTLYRNKLDLNDHKMDNYWLKFTGSFYCAAHPHDMGITYPSCQNIFQYRKDNTESMVSALKASLEEVIKWVITVMDNVKTLEDFMYYQRLVKIPQEYYAVCDRINLSSLLPYSDGAAVFALDDPFVVPKLGREHRLLYADYGLEHNEITEEAYQELVKRINADYDNDCRLISYVVNNPEFVKQTKLELERRKAENIATLDKYGITVGFKKAEAKEKKLTLNAAFKQVFGEMLEPMGFKLIKSKYPYFLRVVGEGIIQSVSVAKEKSIDDPNEEGFTIYIGVNLISAEMPNFDKSPAIFDNMGWMTSLNDWYGNFSQYLDGFNKYYDGDSLFYKKGETEKMLDSLEKVSQEYMPFVLEYIEKLITLEDIYQAGFIVEGGCHDATILLERVDKKIEQLKIALTEEIKRLESVHANNPVLLKIGKEHIIKSTEKLIKRWISFKKGGDAYDEFMKTAEKTKAENLEILKGYGIDADQFE